MNRFHLSTGRCLLPLLAAVALCLAAPFASRANGETVKKLADGFEAAGWHNSPYASAAGTVALSDDAAPVDGSKHSLMIEAHFSGQFGGYSAVPPQPLIIPGDAKTITVQIKIITPGYGVKINFRDGWGRERVDGKYLNWSPNLKKPVGEWETATFKVPKDWVMPLEISGIGTLRSRIVDERT